MVYTKNKKESDSMAISEKVVRDSFSEGPERSVNIWAPTAHWGREHSRTAGTKAPSEMKMILVCSRRERNI